MWRTHKDVAMLIGLDTVGEFGKKMVGQNLGPARHVEPCLRNEIWQCNCDRHEAKESMRMASKQRVKRLRPSDRLPRRTFVVAGGVSDRTPNQRNAAHEPLFVVENASALFVNPAAPLPIVADAHPKSCEVVSLSNRSTSIMITASESSPFALCCASSSAKHGRFPRLSASNCPATCRRLVRAILKFSFVTGPLNTLEQPGPGTHASLDRT